MREGSLNILEFLQQRNRASGRKAVPFEYNRDSDGDDNQLRNDGLGVALLERPHCVFRRGSPFLRDHHDGDERRATFYLRASCTKLELILVCNLDGSLFH